MSIINLIISLVLGIETRYIVELDVRQREVLVLAWCEMGILVVLCIGLSIVDHIFFCLEEGIQCLRGDTPATQVEEAATLHSHLQAALPLQTLAGCILILEIGIWIEGDLALVFCISDVLLYRVLGTLTDGVDDILSFTELSKLYE